jgi:ATP-dependent helicase/nuclease subunit A
VLLYVAQQGEKPFFTVSEITESEGDEGYLPIARKPVITPTEEMLSILNYEYPFSYSVGAAAKISVSELREGLLEDDEYNRSMLSVPASRVALRPKFVDEGVVSSAEIGTANHLFMQFCDFRNVETKGIAYECQRLADIKMLSIQQKEMLNLKTLETFFKSELYVRIKASNRVYREKRFSVRDVIKENGEPILVQGVIDCFFENPDGTFTVVDYKTDRVKNEEELQNRHKLQVSCYRRAVERMTGKKVSQTLLWSFALGKEVAVDED